MEIKHKKIIAKEFLFLLVTIIISLVTLFCCYGYNLFIESEIDKSNEIKNSLIENRKIINHNLDSQKIIQLELLTKYCNRFYPEYNNSKINYIHSDWWNILQKYRNADTAKFYWNTKWRKELVLFHQEYGFKNSKDFSNFVTKNTVTKSDSVFLKEFNNKLRGIYSKNKKLNNKKISNKKIEQYFYNSLIICLLTLFIGRYLIVGFIWSRKVLKQK
jgi:hypothetical protein